MKWALIAAVNNEQVLQSCLLGSLGVASAAEVLLQRRYGSAAQAYNDAISRAQSDILVFAHQDMYFPEGWGERLMGTVEALEREDANWGVLGAWGVTESGGRAGHVYCTAGIRMLGGAFEGVRQIRVLDEVVLIFRKARGLRFDEQLPGFHLYGADLCLEAERRDLKCYAMSAFCIHNSNMYSMLPWEFWKAYLMLRSKWKSRLPILTPCVLITRSCWPMLHWNMERAVSLLTGRNKPLGKRVENPATLYNEMLRTRVVTALADCAQSGGRTGVA